MHISLAEDGQIKIDLSADQAMRLWKIVLDLERSLCPVERAFRLRLADSLFDVLMVAVLGRDMLQAELGIEDSDGVANWRDRLG